MIEKDSMRWLSDDGEEFRVGEKHYSSGRRIGGVRECTLQVDFAEEGLP